MAIPNNPTYGDIPPEVLRYLQMPGVNQQKALEWFSLGLSEPQTFNQARLLAEAVGYSPEQAKVVAGQWQFESAGGSKVPANFNYFGIKSHNEAVRNKLTERGITVGIGDEAQTAKGKATFMQFSNAFEGFAAHKAFLETNSRYENALKAETAKDFALGLGAAGYADASYGDTLYNDYVLPKEKKPESGDTRPKSLGTPKSSANAQKEAEKLTAGIPQENMPKLSPKPISELPALPSITIPTEPTRQQAQEGAVAYEQKPAEYDPVEFSAPKGFFGSGQTMFAGGGHLNFKSPAAYKAWLAYGHASGEFAKTPGHQKVAIKGKTHKVKHEDGGPLQGIPPFNVSGPRNEELPPLTDSEMKAKMAYEAATGNTAAQRMLSLNPKTYDFGNGTFGTHFMSSADNYAFPTLQDTGGQSLEYIENPGPSKEDFRFSTPEQAQFFAENYKTVAPMSTGRYRDGGSLTPPPLPNDYMQFEQFAKTLPDNLQDPNYQYGNSNQYDLYGMWSTAGKPKSFEEVKDTEYFPLQEDGTYHGFSVGADGTLLKPMGHSTNWKEVMNAELNMDPYFRQNRLIQNEQGRLQYVPKKDGGKLDDPQPSAKGFALFPSMYGQVDWATRSSLPEGAQSLGNRNWMESMKVAHDINKRIRNKEVGYTADGTPIDYSQYAKVSPKFFRSKDNMENVKFAMGGTMNTTDPINPPKRKSIPAIQNYRFTPPADYNKYLKERQAEWNTVYDPSTGQMLQGADDASGGGMRKATAEEMAKRMAEIEAMPQRDLLQSHLEEYEAIKAGLYFKRGDANDPTGSARYASFYPIMDLRKTYPAPAPTPAPSSTLPALPPIEDGIVPIEPEPEYAFRDVTQILRDEQGNYVTHRTLSADKVKEMYKQGVNDPAIAPYWTSEYNAPGGESVEGNQGTYFEIPRTMNVREFAAGGKMGDPPPTNMDPYLMYQQNLLSELKGLKNSPVNLDVNPEDFMVRLPTLSVPSRVVSTQRNENVPPYVTEFSSIPYSNYRDTQTLMQESNNYKAKQAEAENYYRSYAMGGPMDQLTQFTEGGTHEENPMGGIPQGMSPDGKMNLVEEGETKHNSEDYIFSDSLKIDKSIAKEFNLTAGMVGKTFAEASKKANRSNSRRENDSIEQKAIKRDLDNLMAAQEAFKAKEVENKVMELKSLAPEMFTAPQGGLPPMTPEMNTFMCGGKKYEFGGNIKNPELMTKIGQGFQAASPFLNVIPGVGQVASLAAAGIGTGLTMAGKAGMEYQNKLAAETEAAKMKGLASDQTMGMPVVNRYGGNMYALGGPLEEDVIPLEKENPTTPKDHYNVNTELGSTEQDLRTHSSLVGSLSGLAGTAYNLYQGIKKPDYVRPEELYKEVEFQRPDYTQAEVAARQDYAAMLRSMGQSGISGGSGILNKLAAAEQMKQRTNEIMSAEENAARQLENEAAKMNAMQFAEAKKTSLDANWRMDAARQESIKQAIQDVQNREATNVANKLAQSYVALAAPDLVGEGKIQVGHQSYPEWLRNKYLRGKK